MAGSDGNSQCAADLAEELPDDLGPLLAELAEKLSDALSAILAEHHRSLQRHVKDWLAGSDVALEYVTAGDLGQRAAAPARPVSRLHWLGCGDSTDDGGGGGGAAPPPAPSRPVLLRGPSLGSEGLELRMGAVWDTGGAHGGDGLANGRTSTYSDAVMAARRMARSASFIKQSREWRKQRVSLDEPWYARLRRRARGAMQSPPCNYFLTAVIVLNIVTMGAEVGDLGGRVRTVLIHVQHACNVIFVVELAVRVFVEGRQYLLGSDRLLNVLDTLLVGVSLLELATQAVNATAASGALGNVMILKLARVIRVIRVIRVLRILRFFRPLRVLVHSICATMRSLAYAILLLGTIMYCFGIVFTQAARDNPSDRMARHFGSLFQSVLTLFESVTNGVSWGLVHEPLYRASWVYGIMFILYVVFAQLAVLNVMTGQFVQGAIESTRQCDEEMISEQLAHKHFYAMKFRAIFDRLSADGESVTLANFERHMDDDRLRALLSSLGITVSDAWTLFRLLDKGPDHCLDPEQFVDGCLRLHGNATAIGLRSLEDQLRWFIRHVDKQVAQLMRSPTPEDDTAFAADFTV